MTILFAALLGIVEGITEFLPISSTGHLILTQKLLGMQNSEMLATFDIAIQLGAICAVVIVYWKSIRWNPSVWLPVFTAFLPTAILGLLLHKIIKTYFLGSSSIVAWALLIGGIVIIIFELLHKQGSGIPLAAEALEAKVASRGQIHSLQKVPLTTAFGIGLFQSFALIPGVSRSAATIIGGMMLGVERKTIVDFSFLLAIPTMAAATGYDLMKSASQFHAHDVLTLGVGFFMAFITALIAIRWLLVFIKKNTFVPFGVYRIIVGILMLGFLLR